MSITIDETTLFESLLSYALFGGAIFQLICIFAIMFVPENEADQQMSKVRDNPNSSVDRQSSSSSTNRVQENVSRKGKREKKKHR